MQLCNNTVLIGGIIWALTACGEVSTLPTSAGMGSKPILPLPKHKLIPTIKIAPAIGWSSSDKPVAMRGLSVKAFGSGLQHPRWLYVLPNGDVLVAETNAPPKPEDGKGIKGWIMGAVMKKAGAGVPSANRITLLRDTDSDGIADVRSVLLENLNSPFGMALIDKNLYIANSNVVLQFPYTKGDMRILSTGIKLLDLPAGKINHHWTKNLIASADGKNYM
jgi:glucose/arabinose dehydrogenase